MVSEVSKSNQIQIDNRLNLIKEMVKIFKEIVNSLSTNKSLFYTKNILENYPKVFKNLFL